MKCSTENVKHFISSRYVMMYQNICHKIYCLKAILPSQSVCVVCEPVLLWVSPFLSQSVCVDGVCE